MLIGRKKEQEQLLNAMCEEDSMFVAVYGRRRVGKTYLVRETLGNRFTFCHTGLAKSPMKKQLAAWKLSLREYGIKRLCQHLHNLFKPEEWSDQEGVKHNRVLLVATKFYETPDKEEAPKEEEKKSKKKAK